MNDRALAFAIVFAVAGFLVWAAILRLVRIRSAAVAYLLLALIDGGTVIAGVLAYERFA